MAVEDIDTRVMRMANNTESMAVTDFLSAQGVDPAFPAGVTNGNVTMLVALELASDAPRAYNGQRVLGALMLGVAKDGGVEIGAFAVDPSVGEEYARAALTVLGEKVLVLGAIIAGEDLGPEAELALFHDLGKQAGMDEFTRPDSYTTAA